MIVFKAYNKVYFFWTNFNANRQNLARISIVDIGRLNLKFINLIFRLCGQELEIINNLIKGHKRPLVQQQNEVTFSLYEQIEQGFYKCHDSIYDVPEGQRIPDLMKKRPATTTKVKDAETVSYCKKQHYLTFSFTTFTMKT